ncbi:MAG: hypothetical protein K2G85_06810, partial [Muribaculaceae bacterium]|nr:hypothetical protein [Muribaculaceae bacterium]
EKPRRFNDERPRRFNDERPRRFNDEKPRRFNDEKPRRFNDEKPRRFNENNYSNKSEARTIANKGPKLTNFTETRAPGKMRSRKNFKNSFLQDDDE